MAKGILQGCNIAISGNFGQDRDAIAFKRWIDYHGGKFSGTKVEPGVTHLICTDANYRNLVAAVQKADQLRISIVTYDWLEESLAAKHKYMARGKFLVKNHCKMSAAEKRERKKREREALKKDGKDHSAYSEQESAAGMALGFLDEHLEKLKSKPKRAKAKAPVIERHTIYEPLLQAKKAEKHGLEDDDGEKVLDGYEKAPKSRSTTPGCDGTPVLESNSDMSTASSSVVAAANPMRDSGDASKDTSKLDSPQQMRLLREAVPPSHQTPTPSTAFINEPALPSVLHDKIQPVSTKELEGQKSYSKPQLPSDKPKLDNFAQLRAALISKPRKGLIVPSKALPTPPQTLLPPICPLRRAFDTNPESPIANHHLYRDKTSFVYDIKLLRLDLTKNSNERFHMRLYESHTSPHSYAVHLLYFNTRKAVKTPSVQAMGEIPEGGTTIAAIGSAWAVAFKVWREVFEKLTGLKWEERLEVHRAGGIRRDVFGGDGGGERYFKYIAPKAGEPRGIFPPGTKMPVVESARSTLTSINTGLRSQPASLSAQAIVRGGVC